MNAQIVDKEPECPIDAIKADTDEAVEDKEKWLLQKNFLNMAKYFKKKGTNGRSQKIRKVKNKFKNHFSEKPAK